MNAKHGTILPGLFGAGVAVGGGAIAAPQGAVAKSGPGRQTLLDVVSRYAPGP